MASAQPAVAVEKKGWVAPAPELKPLMVNNTMSHSKVKFTPVGGNYVTWYSCGPTVYDSSHMGHARTYMAIDIIRRILEDYFGYSVFSVMNITDIDDKIILKARRGHLVKEYVSSNPSAVEKVLDDLESGWKSQEEKLNIKKQDVFVAAEKGEKGMKKDEAAAMIKLISDDLSKVYEAKTRLGKAREAAIAGKPEDTLSLLAEISGSSDVLGQILDTRFGADVKGIKEICKEHALKYEREFMEDMATLGVRSPAALTRVSEYMEKIVAYIMKIIENGFAYSSNGSVYFDTAAFARHPDHTYGKLAPQSIGDLKLAGEGEGELSQTPAKDGAPSVQSEKRNPSDFALWKKSKPGEPQWESPWGAGRPGWHIECSAMASDVIGRRVDIHFGGEDLKFPHHDNELAQAEAYYGSQQWVDYFFHSGHLHIDGLKMSKSLKNFITIREALRTYSPRQMRLMVLLQAWDSTMNYSRQAMKHVVSTDDTLVEFFHQIKNIFRVSSQVQGGTYASDQAWSEKEFALRDALLRAQKGVDERLRDNFDTPGAMGFIMELIRRTNDYIQNMDVKNARILLVKQVTSFVTKILKVFGLVTDSQVIGFGEQPTAGASSSSSTDSVSKEEILAPFLDELATFRKQVRQRAREIKDDGLLGICDQIRDDVMPKLGLRLEDDSKFAWKLGTPEEAIRLVQERKANERAVRLKKATNRLSGLQGDLEQWEGFSKSPEEFLVSLGEYQLPVPEGAADGLPTHDKTGKELGKKRREKLAKQMDTQRKGHEKYLKAIQENPNFLDEFRAKIVACNAEIAALK